MSLPEKEFQLLKEESDNDDNKFEVNSTDNESDCDSDN